MGSRSSRRQIMMSQKIKTIISQHRNKINILTGKWSRVGMEVWKQSYLKPKDQQYIIISFTANNTQCCMVTENRFASLLVIWHFRECWSPLSTSALTDSFCWPPCHYSLIHWCGGQLKQIRAVEETWTPFGSVSVPDRFWATSSL